MRLIRAMSKWRSQFNPLRGMTLQRVVSMIEAGEGGQYADLQWAYRAIEKREPTLRGLKRLRLSALGKLDWNIKLADESPEAARQAAALRAAYDKIANLNEAFRFLALAEFRGYSHLEKIYDGDNPANAIIRLEPVEQWHWVRDGLYGEWEYNAKAENIAHGEPVDPRHFIIREVEDPINEIAFICYLRKNLSQKDWDGFVEVFGIPPLFVEMPPNIPAGKEDEYQQMAEDVVSDTRGTLPSGSKIHTVADGSRGTNPFRQHLDYQDEQLVLAGTSGKLTMLTAPTGLNGDVGGTHNDIFDELAAAEAAEISELFQRQFDKTILRAQFPGQTVKAYFSLAAEDKADIGQILDHAVKITQAGGKIDLAELSEKTGYTINETPPAAPQPFAHFPQTRNRGERQAAAKRELFRAAALQKLGKAQAQALQPLLSRLADIVELPDDKFTEGLAAFRDKLPALAKEVFASDASGELEKTWEEILGASLKNP